ncbi:type II toxin-antitoxin system RelE/ParE family toxin [Thiorhodovibrio frisius]
MKDGYRGYSQGSHVIFYLIRESCIGIIGVLHQRMDASSHLDPSDQ